MPDAFKFPRVRRAVVPLVSARNTVIDELVSDGRPGFAAVVGALNLLAEPAVRLRAIKTIRIGGRSFQVINLPASEMRAVDLPVLPLSV
jgi:hypothetical protein